MKLEEFFPIRKKEKSSGFFIWRKTYGYFLYRNCHRHSLYGNYAFYRLVFEKYDIQQ